MPAALYLRRAMMEKLRNFGWGAAAFALLLASFIPTSVAGQILDPVKWDIGLHPASESGTTDLVFHASVEPCWHIYSQHLENDMGPLPTYFEISLPEGATFDPTIHGHWSQQVGDQPLVTVFIKG